MYVVIVGLTIAPLLETWFTMAQAAHLRLSEIGCALMHICGISLHRPSWCSNVMCRRDIKHLDHCERLVSVRYRLS